MLDTRALNEVVKNSIQLLDEVEQKYAYIYDTLPKSERDVNLGIEEVEILLNFFLSLINQAVTEIATEFNRIINSFIDQELVDLILDKFLNKSDDVREGFNGIMHLSDRMEDAIGSLKDLALNSIIYSSQVGEQGAAFQVLSLRINQVSSSIDHNFGQLNSTLTSLFNWNEKFRESIGDYIHFETEMKEEFSVQYNEKFQSINQTLAAASSLQLDNLSKTKTAFSEVGKIMVMIQHHDIIRQSLENLTHCIKKGIERQNDPVFIKHTTILAISLLDKIEELLNESILSLSHIVGGMYQDVNELDSDSIAISKYLVGETDKSQAMMQDMFNGLLDQFQGLLQFKNKIDHRSAEIIQQKDAFYRMMGSVEQDFEQIFDDMRRLKQMKVLIKIELARIDLKNGFNQNDFISAIDGVIETVNESRKTFLKLKEYFLKNMDKFASIIDGTQNQMVGSMTAIDQSESKLNIAYKLSLDVYRYSTLEMQEIFNRLRQPYHRLANTVAIRNLLQNMKEELQNQLKQLLAVEGQLSEEDIHLLEKQLTCQSERQIFRNLFGECGESTEGQAGEIELF